MSVIGYRRNIPTKFIILEGVEINEQLSPRNSLNALCYQTNYANFVFPTMFMSEVLKVTSSCHEFVECFLLSVELSELGFSPELASVCLGTGHKIAINNRC